MLYFLIIFFHILHCYFTIRTKLKQELSHNCCCWHCLKIISLRRLKCSQVLNFNSVSYLFTLEKQKSLYIVQEVVFVELQNHSLVTLFIEAIIDLENNDGFIFSRSSKSWRFTSFFYTIMVLSLLTKRNS